MLAQDIQQKMTALQRAAQELVQILNVLDNRYDTKETELRNLQAKIDKLKPVFDENNEKATKLLSDASEMSARIKKEAEALMESARIEKAQAKVDQERAKVALAEADAALRQAAEKQKTADQEYRNLEEKKKKLQEAMR